MKLRGNKREFFRVKLDNPICAEMTVASIGNKSIRVGKKPVCIQNISAGGLCFMSDLNFPVNDEVILEFSMKILNQEINLPGCVVRKSTVTASTFEYGVQFIAIDESERANLFKLLNNLLIRINDSTYVSNCSNCKLRQIHTCKTINKIIKTNNFMLNHAFYY